MMATMATTTATTVLMKMMDDVTKNDALANETKGYTYITHGKERKHTTSGRFRR